MFPYNSTMPLTYDRFLARTHVGEGLYAVTQGAERLIDTGTLFQPVASRTSGIGSLTAWVKVLIWVVVTKYKTVVNRNT